MERTVCIFLFTLFLLHCGEDGLSHRNLPRATGSNPGRVFPLKTLIGDVGTEYLAGTTRLEELFEPHAFIRLEATDASTFGAVTDLVFLDESWFVLDQYTSRVYRFTDEGTYLSSFGGKGEGPGTFQYPKLIQRCHDDLLGVADPVRGDIQLFDKQGTVVGRSRFRSGDHAFRVAYAFDWSRSDRLVLVGFNSANRDAPVHVVLDPTGPTQEIKTTFGERIPVVEKAAAAGVPRKIHTAFAEIEGRYWTGSPYQTHVEVYDEDGGLLGRLGNDIRRDRRVFLHAEDIADLDKIRKPREKMRNEILPKYANQLIRQVGKLVIVQMYGAFDVYDLEGNLLAAGLGSDFIHLSYAHGNLLVRVLDPVNWQSWFDDSDITTMIERSGFNRDDNPGLLVLRLKPPFRAPTGLGPDQGGGR